MKEYEKFQVKCEEPVIRKAILDVADESGWEAECSIDCILCYPYIVFRERYSSNSDFSHGFGPILPIEEALPLIKAGPPKPEPKPITVAGETVEVLENGNVKVGCTMVPKDVMERLVGRVEEEPIMLDGALVADYRHRDGTFDKIGWKGNEIPKSAVHEIIKRWKEAQ